MEGLALLALVVLGLLIAAPFVAFSALNKAKKSLSDVTELKALVFNLQDEIAKLRRSGPQVSPGPEERAVPEVWQPWVRPDASAPDVLDAGQASPQPRAPSLETPDIVEPVPAAIADAAPSQPDETPPEPAVARAIADDAGPATPTGSEPPDASADDPAWRDHAAPEGAAEAAAPIEAPRARDFEESIGSRWAVWVGGVALAFGGLFLVRYSIEMGLFGPGVRLLMGAAFAIACGVASEFVRRSDIRLSLGKLPPTQIPSLLAGVGVLSGFGVVYAAHGVYEFIGPTLAFTLMGLIGVGALLVSIVHGPLFGLFGLVGSYATPLLVSSSAPAFASLSLFIAGVTCVAFLLHARRAQTIVTLGAVVGHNLWTWLIAAHEPPDRTWSSMLLIVAAATGLALLKEIPAARARAVANDNAATDGWFTKHFDAITFAALATPLVLSGFIWVAFGGPAATHAAILATVTIAIVAAVRHDDVSPLAPLAGAAATGMILLWPTSDGPMGISPRLIFDLVRLDMGVDNAPGIVWTAIFFALVVSALTFNALRARRGAGDGDVVTRGCLAFASALTPICLMLATALRVNGFNRSTLFALIALALAIALFAASEIILAIERRRTVSRDNPLALVGSAAYAAGAAISLGLSLAFAFRETWLVVGLAVAAAGVALVASVRPIPLLRSMSAALATAAFGRFLWQPFLTDVGSWPLLNWLIIAYALPALCFAAGALLLSGRTDRPRRLHEAFAAIFGAAFVILEVRQFFAGPDLVPTWALINGHWLTPRNRLFEEVAVQIAAIGGIGACLQWLNRRTGGGVFLAGADLAAFALLIVALGGLCGFVNPLFDGTAVSGPPIFNRLLFYPIIGAILGGIAFAMKRRLRASRMTDALDAAGAVLVALGAALIVRHAFAGPRLVVTTGGNVGFFEVVTLTIVLTALAAASRIWLEAGGGRVVELIVRGLALLSIGLAVISLALWRNPMIDLSGVDGPIIFNRILWGYGAVALAFAGASHWMRDATPTIASTYRRAAIGFALLGVFLLMRHGFHGRLLMSDEQVTLAEAGWYASIGFVIAIFLSLKGSFTLLGAPTRVSPAGAAIASAAVFAVFPGFIANPLMTEARLAGVLLFDNALIGYVAPALLAYVAARWARDHADDLTRRVYGASAIIGGFIYLMIEVRRWFVGPDLMAQGSDETELYAYSAVVILYGVALLGLGFKLASKDLRLAAMAVVTLAVCKVFLIDMAGLQGLLRALSFIGLGGSLVAIGLVYQRLLQREALKPAAPVAAAQR